MNVKNWTVYELQEAICKVSGSCPFLEEIKITWCCESPLSTDDVISQLKAKRIFPSKVEFVDFCI